MCRYVQYVEETRVPTEGSVLKPGTKVKPPAILLTWIGKWGCVNVGDAFPLETEPLCEFLSSHPVVLSLWSHFGEYVSALVSKFGLEAFAYCCEVCTRTLDREKQVRVHFHAWFAIPHRTEQALFSNMLQYRNTAPYFSSASLGKGRGHTKFSGCYYVMAPKIGSVLRTGSKEPFVDFAVNPTWITALFAGRKISARVAVQER